MDDDNANRRKIADVYLRGLSDISELRLPTEMPDRSHLWHLFVVRHSARFKLQKELKILRIETLIHNPIPPHIQQARAELPFRKGSHPISELIYEEVLSLPIGPTMTLRDANRVAESVQSTLRK